MSDIMIGKEVRNGNNTYHILQYVGRGRQSEVFKARLMESGQIVAVKHLIKLASAHRFRREASILARLNDPCVVHFVDFFEIYGFGNQEAFLVMDFLPGMPGSSLRDAIKRTGGAPLPLRETLLAFARFAHGLSVLHSHGIIHRNIKPANLYYPTGRPDAAAIMDLGIARDVNGTQTLGKVPGTLDYMPPEVVTTSNRGGPGMDLYALGLSLYVALTGKTAYPLLPQGSAAVAAFYERVRSQTQPTFDSPVVTSRPKLLRLLKDMTNLDPQKRICDAAEVERRLSELAATVNEQDQSMPVDELEDYIDDADTIMDENPLLPEECELLLKEQERLEKRRRAFWTVGVFVATIGVLSMVWVIYGASLTFKIACDLLMVAWLGVICVLEFKTRRIPNLLTFGGLASWLLLDFASGGLGGVVSGIKAGGIGLLIILPLFLIRAIGGGDVKMIVACCAYVGFSRLLPFGVLLIVIGLIMGAGVLFDSLWNRHDNAHESEMHKSYPCSPIVAAAMFTTLLLKWVGWI